MLKEVWVTRDKYGDNEYLYADDKFINVWKIKPLMVEEEDEIAYDSESETEPIIWYMRTDEFEEAFGFVPEKGSCKLYDLNLTQKGEKVNGTASNSSNSNQNESSRESC